MERPRDQPRGLELAFAQRRPVLRDLLEQHANRLIAQLPKQGGIVHEVRRLLAKRIMGGNTKIESWPVNSQ